MGITRVYATRHGAGPFVTEDAELSRALPDACNGTGAWQQHFRVGWLDLVMLRYALETVGPLDYLAMTCLDRLAALPTLQLCTAYEVDNRLLDRLAPSPTSQDLTYQARLTAQVLRCQPRLTEVASVTELVEQVAVALQLRVGLLSAGPTAADKQLLSPSDML